MKMRWSVLGLIVLVAAVASWQDSAVIAHARHASPAKDSVFALELFLVTVAWRIVEPIEAARTWLRANAPLASVIVFVCGVELRDWLDSLLRRPLVPPRDALLLFGYSCIGIALAVVRTERPSTRVDAIALTVVVTQAAVATAGLLLAGERAAAALMVAGGAFGAICLGVRMWRRNLEARRGRSVAVRERRLTRARTTAP
jgi:hypothetical protein